MSFLRSPYLPTKISERIVPMRIKARRNDHEIGVESAFDIGQRIAEGLSMALAEVPPRRGIFKVNPVPFSVTDFIARAPVPG